MPPFSCIRRFLASEAGPTAVEYATALSLIVVLCLPTIMAVGKNANSAFAKTASSIPSAQQQTTGATSPTAPSAVGGTH